MKTATPTKPTRSRKPAAHKLPPPPKVYSRFRTLKELRAFCKNKGWALDTKRFDEGSDFVTVHWFAGGTFGHMLVSLFNGRFFGKTFSGIEFNSDATTHDGEPWFKELLEAIYL